MYCRDGFLRERECGEIPVTYGAIHWLLRDEGRKSSRPRGQRPMKNLELCKSYSDRVFLKAAGSISSMMTDGTRKLNVNLLEE